MRRFCTLIFAVLLPVFALAGPPPAAPMAPAAKPAAVLPAAPAGPAAAAAGAIIPGSPLADLTGSTPVPGAPDPFGTDTFSLSIMQKIGADANSTIGDFVQAVRRSTELTPVFAWLHRFVTDPADRAAFVDAAMGLILTILPALAAEAIIRYALIRPRDALFRYAITHRKIDFPAAPAGPESGLDNAEAGDIEPQTRRFSAIAWLRRLGLAITYISLASLPIIGFAITTGALLDTPLIATGATRLIITAAGDAYVLARFAQEALRFLFAPKAAELRLIHTSDKRAAWMVRSLSAIVVTIASGEFSIISAENLGLSSDGGLVLTRLFALAIHLQVALLIWQGRHVVARWIRGKPRDAVIAFGIRDRLAGIWHFIALFYVLAIWVAYAAGVHNAFGVLLRIVVVFICGLIAARVLWFGLITVIDRVIDDDGEGTRGHPMLRARLRAYNNLVKLFIRIVILALVAIFMLQGWGINVVPWLLSDPLSRSLINAFIAIVITIAIALTFWEIANYAINARIESLASAGKARQASRLRTLLPMLRASVGVVIFLTAALICLSQVGVNLVPLLAVSGVAGIAIGFGSQKLVQDIITGLFLLLEDAMQVGDVVTLAGMSGTVERLSIRTIRLRGGDGSVNIIPFSSVTTVTNQTRDFGYAEISITVGYQENLDRVTAVLTDIAKKMRAEPQWGAQMRDDLQLFGLDSFGNLGLVILGQIRTGPGQHWSVRREFYARVQKRFAQEGIQIPYNHQSLSIDPSGFRLGGLGNEEGKQGQGALPPGPPPRAQPLEPGPGLGSEGPPTAERLKG